jgi:hypothetical protein
VGDLPVPIYRKRGVGRGEVSDAAIKVILKLVVELAL